MDCCRPIFNKLRSGALPEDMHLGLWLDRALDAQPDMKGTDVERKPLQDATNKLLSEVRRIGAPHGYREHYNRWRKLLDDDGVLACEAATLGRTIVGMGAKNALEFGIFLDHTWGVPVLPGSSLKGIAAATAHRLAKQAEWQKGGSQYNAMFGTTDESGVVRFLDAWRVPDSKPLVQRDVMTVHHPDYYQKDEPVPPSDMDSPTPIAFLSVSGTYLLAVEGPADWADVAMTLLQKGLREFGIGAKTNAGYGRLAMDYASKADQRRVEEDAKRKQDEILRKKAEDAAAASDAKAQQELMELERFKAAMLKAKDNERPQVLMRCWSSLGGQVPNAAQWLFDDVWKLDLAEADRKYKTKSYYDAVRRAYLAAKRG